MESNHQPKGSTMQAHQTISTIADEAYRMFETRERESGENYVTLKDEAPQWLRDIVHDAHGDMLPDDWRYQTIRNALSEIGDSAVEDGDELDDLAHEFADSNVDTYNSDRTVWLSSHLSRAGYCDEALSEFGPSDQGVIGIIGQGQYMESMEVFQAVAQGLRDRVNDLESAES